jgi:hypothetical protein
MRTIKSAGDQLIKQLDLETHVYSPCMFEACSGRFYVDVESE